MWTLQDEKHIDKDGMYSWEGTHLLEDGQYLTLYYPVHEHNPLPDKIYWEGELILIKTYDKKRLKKFGLSHYIKKHATGLEQLQLGGYWVHTLPAKMDLAVWYRICFLKENWTGKISI